MISRQLINEEMIVRGCITGICNIWCCTKMPKQNRQQGSCSWICTAVLGHCVYNQSFLRSASVWKILLQYSCMNTETWIHSQQKALKLEHFFILKSRYFRSYLKSQCGNSCFCMICSPLVIYGTVFSYWLFPIVCRKNLMKLQCLTWILPLPYWEVLCVWCNVFIVLWIIRVVAQNKAWFCISNYKMLLMGQLCQNRTPWD